jgi:amino acid transporter
MTRRWINWFATLAVVTIAGLVLLPAIRRLPEAVHSHFSAVGRWQGALVCLALSVVSVFLLFKLLSPRLPHLKTALHNPPAWAAWLIAACIVCGVDLLRGLDPAGYQASGWEWALFGGGAVIIVALYQHLTSTKRPPPPDDSRSSNATLDDLLRDWPTLERWLRADSPADEDLLGNRRVARRLVLGHTCEFG